MYGAVGEDQQRCAVPLEANVECSALLPHARRPCATRGVVTFPCSDPRQTIGSSVGPCAVMSPRQGVGVENHAAQGG
eukprot:16026-Eustigmatos_ZCMA.PRE.1